jgi:apolipoprotein N-acyltransferase
MNWHRLLEEQGALPALFAGVLWALAFPPFGLFLLAFVFLVPLLTCVRGARRRRAFRNGWLTGATFALANFFWVAQFVGKWTGSWLLGAVPLLLMAAAFGVYIGLFAVAASALMSRGLWWLIPFAWAGVEVFRSVVPYLFFPWSLTASALAPLPVLLQPAWWGGSYLLGAWVALGSVLLVAFLTARSEEPLAVNVRAVGWATVLWAALPVLGIWAFTQPLEGREVRLAAIQTGVNMAFGPDGRPTSREAVQAGVARTVPVLLQQARDADVAVLPEGIVDAVADQPPHLPFAYHGAPPLVTGGVREVGDIAYQALFTFDRRWQYADKTRLVIFGEYVPFREYLPFLDAYQLPSGDLTPAEEVRTLTVNGVRIGGLLCFEGLFEEVARAHLENGARVLALLTVDDWYQGTGAIEHLVQTAVLRAAENRVPLVRASPLGPSLVVESRGRVVARSAPGRPAVAAATVVLEESRVFPLRRAAPTICLAALIFGLILAFSRDLGRKTQEPAANDGAGT